MTKMTLSPFTETITADGSSNLVSSNPTGAGTGLLFTPTYLLDAESATLGATYEGTASDQWTDSAGATLGSNVNVFEGAKTFRMFIAQGETGFGQWGGVKQFPDIAKGSSLQVQFTVYFPSGFAFTASSGALKLFRAHVATSVGGNVGYHDILVDDGTFDGTGPRGRLLQNFEGDPGIGRTTTTISDAAQETLEVRIDFDDVALDSAGTGRTRIWRKESGVMVLIWDETDTKTLNASTDVCDSINLFTYWNGGAPVDSTVYLDRLVIETDLAKLVETDAAGTKIIGGVS